MPLWANIFFVTFFAPPAPAQTSQQNTIPEDSSGNSNIIDRSSSLAAPLGKLRQFPSRYFGKIDQKTTKFDQQLIRTTGKALQKLQYQESAIHNKLSRIDSVAAHNLVSASLNPLSHLHDLVKGKVTNLTNHIPGGEYIPYLDSLQNALNFLNKYPGQLYRISNLHHLT